MSRDKGGTPTQEVVGWSPISSTNHIGSTWPQHAPGCGTIYPRKIGKLSTVRSCGSQIPL